MEFAKCAICAQEMPIELINEHHVIPASRGGSDNASNFAGCCSGCHQNAHRVAEMIVNSKREKAEQTARMVYEGEAYTRFMYFVTQIVESEYLEFKVEESTLIIKLPTEAYRRLKNLAYERRHPGTNRRVGATRLGREIVLQYLESKGIWPPQENKATLADIAPADLRALTPEP